MACPASKEVRLPLYESTAIRIFMVGWIYNWIKVQNYKEEVNKEGKICSFGWNFLLLFSSQLAGGLGGCNMNVEYRRLLNVFFYFRISQI